MTTSILSPVTGSPVARGLVHWLAAAALGLGTPLLLPAPASASIPPTGHLHAPLLLDVASSGVATASAALTPESAPPVNITVQRREIAVNVGDEFVLPTTITNESGEPLRGFIAHLDILGTDRGRYVDPEDWCTERTVFLDPLDPAESVRVDWPMRAVDSGPLLVWITVTRAEGQAVAISQPARLVVGEHVDVNAGGVLPLVVGVPVLLFGSAAAAAWRRRRMAAA